MRKFWLFILVILISILLWVHHVQTWNKNHYCIKGNYEIVHHYEWVQYVTTSIKPFIQVPIIHSAYDAKEFVCKEHK